MTQENQSGFTLIELMIAVAIVGILMAIALPNYRAYTQKTAREVVKADLLRLAAEAERFKSQRFTYTGLSTATLSCTNSPCDGGAAKYTITFTPAASGVTYDLVATSTDAQDGNTSAVEVLQINQLNQRCGKLLSASGTSCSYSGTVGWNDLHF